MAFHVGQIIEGYQIIGELGRGGNGIVFKAKAVQGDQTIAIKVPWRKRIKNDPAILENMLREASTIARLEHVYIAKHLRVGVCTMDEDEIPYLMMELVDGVPASDLRRGSVYRIVTLMEKVAEAVYHAHKQRVIHCDLKPTNILIDRFGNPKILDFGLARLLVDRVNSSSGIFQGTPLYAAPEQFLGNVDERTDIWSLGAILFDLLTGRPPFVAENWEELLSVQNLFASQEMAIHLRTPKPSELNPEADAYLDEVCRTAMSKNPQKRYQSADEMVEALKKWARQHREAWADKAHTIISVCRFLPRSLRRGLLDKAYRHLEKALSYDIATAPLKDNLRQLFKLREGNDICLLELQPPRGKEEWDKLRQNLQTIMRLDHPCLATISHVVFGTAKGVLIPHQILLVCQQPTGTRLAEGWKKLAAEEAAELCEAIVDLLTQVCRAGMDPGFPELEDIFVNPIQVVPVGWPFRKQKENQGVQMAATLYQVSTGRLFDKDHEQAERLPDKWRDSLLSVLRGTMRVTSVLELIATLEYSAEVETILRSGSLDHAFTFPPGEFHLTKTLRILPTGHLKLQGNTRLLMSPQTGIECYGQLTAKGIWNKETTQGSIYFGPEDSERGWAGFYFGKEIGPDKPILLEGCEVDGGRGLGSEELTHGGAIRFAGSRLKITGALFRNNQATGAGGAIYLQAMAMGLMEVELAETHFERNVAQLDGGAIAIDGNCKQSLQNCCYRDNRAGESGGAIAIAGTESGKYCEMILRGVQFKNNRAGRGGAVAAGIFTRAKFDNCQFAHNQADQCGGSVHIFGHAQGSSQVTFAQTAFAENSCQMDGGAIYGGDYSLLLLESGCFEQNAAHNHGGAIFCCGKEDQSATKITLRQMTLSRNHSKLDGGAIFAGIFTRVILEECLLQENQAEGNCGAISLTGQPSAEASKLKLRKVNFTKNYAKGDGGAIAGGINTQMILEECSFLENAADGSCGAVGLTGKDSNNLGAATFKDVDFTGNHCLIDGGAMVIGYYSRTKFEKCRWEANYSQKNTGGAILILGKEAECPTFADFYDATFQNNHSQIDGGAININIYTQTSFEHCVFQENFAIEKNGGALVLLGKDGGFLTRATFRQVVFHANYCQVSGGAVNANDYTRSLFVDCTFSQNRAKTKNGGAILVLGEDGQYPSEAKFQKVSFDKNDCKGSGGAVNANVFTITAFEECRFELNNADEHGGGIFIKGLRRIPNKSTVKACFFSGNTAGKSGADVAIRAVKGVTEESLLQENTIEIQGPDFLAEEQEEQYLQLSPDTHEKSIPPNSRGRIAEKISNPDFEGEDNEATTD